MGDEQLVQNQVATMSLFNIGAPRQKKKKPSASQQWRFELHTSLRSYSQLTLTQSRHRKKVIQPSSQAGRQTGRQKGGKSLLKCSLSFIPRGFLFSFPIFLYCIFFPHLHFSPLRLCRVPPPFPVAGVSLCVCLASHSCHSRASRGLLSRRGQLTLSPE